MPKKQLTWSNHSIYTGQKASEISKNIGEEAFREKALAMQDRAMGTAGYVRVDAKKAQ